MTARYQGKPGESTVYSLREQHDSVFLEFVHARFLFEKPAVQFPVRESSAALQASLPVKHWINFVVAVIIAVFRF